MKDIMTIDKVIGVGEIAISDHRSSQPNLEDVKKLTADTRVAGILSSKAGVVNIHLGDGRRMINILKEIIDNTEIPYSQFIPTHMNRNPHLFEEAIRYANSGGYIDFTTSSVPVFKEAGEFKSGMALSICLNRGVPVERISFSSDGQGSLPVFNEKKEFVGLKVGKCSTLFDEVRNAVLQEGVSFENAIRVITSNPASNLKLKSKGRVAKGFDADLVLLDEKGLQINTVIAKGQIMIRDKEIKVYGTFEK
jgi:beta-aspartyl-dipeptidase (metallo-type)